MKVGLLTADLSMKGGGVGQVVNELAVSLHARGVDAPVFGLEFPGHPSPTREARLSRVRGPRAFGYAPGLTRSLAGAGLDVLHTHGLWMYPSVATLRWSRRQSPYVVSPHGMLDAWALSNSRRRKMLALGVYERRHLEGAAALHALTDAEYRSMRDLGLENPICIIPNGVEIPGHPENDSPGVEAGWLAHLSPGARVLLYLGRIHPKKGLCKLLAAWREFRKAPRAGEWILVIAGWDQNGHEGELRNLAGQLGIADSVIFAGPQSGSAKAQTFRRAELVVLPSVSEGLPMAVLESWSYARPTIITPACNLPEGADAGAAIVCDPTVEGLHQAIAAAASMPVGELRSMGSRALGLVRARFSWDRIADDFRQLYTWVLHGGPPPGTVRTH